jgi:hypothetical protein
MIVRHSDAIQQWKRAGTFAVIGAVIAAEIVALVIAGIEVVFFQIILASLAAAAGGAVLATLASFALGIRKYDNLSDLERALTQATGLLEQGLLSEPEYDRIRGQIVEQYRYEPRRRIPVLRWTLWGTATGLLVPLLLILMLWTGRSETGYFLALMAASSAGAVVSGAGTAAVLFARRKMAEHQLESGSNRPMLNAK